MLMIVFRVGKQRYGLPADQVREIVPRPTLVEPAGAPSVLSGLLNLRGQYLPVLDGHVLIGEEPVRDIHSQIIITGETKAELGLLVDRVEDLRSFHTRTVATLNDGAAAPFMQQVVDTGDGSVLLFDQSALRRIAPSNRADDVQPYQAAHDAPTEHDVLAPSEALTDAGTARMFDLQALREIAPTLTQEPPNV